MSRAFKAVLTAVIVIVIALGGVVWLIGFQLVSAEIDELRPTWVTPSPLPNSPSTSPRR